MAIGNKIRSTNKDNLKTMVKTVNILRNLQFDKNQFCTQNTSNGVNISLANPQYFQFFEAFSNEYKGTANYGNIGWGKEGLALNYLKDPIYIHDRGSDTITLTKPGKYIVSVKLLINAAKSTNFMSSFNATLYTFLCTKNDVSLDYMDMTHFSTIMPDPHIIPDHGTFSHTFAVGAEWNDYRSSILYAFIDFDQDLVDGILKVRQYGDKDLFMIPWGTQLNIVGPFNNYNRKKIN